MAEIVDLKEELLCSIFALVETKFLMERSLQASSFKSSRLP